MCGIVEFLHPIAVLEDLARLGAVRRADDTVLLHKVDEARRAAITDAQAALQCGSGCAAGIADHANRILVKIVVDIFSAVGVTVRTRFGLAVLILRRREEFFLLLRLGLLTPEIAHRRDLIFAHQRSVKGMEPRHTYWHLLHVPSA